MKIKASWFIYAAMNFVKDRQAHADFTLVHITDFHLCRPETAPLAAFASKRVLSYLSWRIRRRHRHDPAILEAVVRHAKDQAADHVVMTGDLTQLALPGECEAARRCLKSIGPPRDVFLIPGNHDALVAAGWDERLSRWAGYLAADGSGAPERARWPALRIRGPVALIGLSSAHPTPPLSATGRIGPDQLARCSELLAEAGRRSLYRVLLVHHPPVPGMLSARRRLEDADGLADVVRQRGAELILHGHIHRRSRAYLPGPAGPIPVIGSPSASETSPDPVHRAGFGIFRIARNGTGWQTTLQDFWYSKEQKRLFSGAIDSVKKFPPHLVSNSDNTYL